MKQQFEAMQRELASHLQKGQVEKDVWFAFLLSILSLLKEIEDETGSVLNLLLTNAKDPNDQIVKSPWVQKNLSIIKKRIELIVSNKEVYQSYMLEKAVRSIASNLSKDHVVLNSIINRNMSDSVSVPVFKEPKKKKVTRRTINLDEGSSSASRVDNGLLESPPQAKPERRIYIPAPIEPAKIPGESPLSQTITQAVINQNAMEVQVALTAPDKQTEADLKAAIKIYQNKLKFLHQLSSIDLKTLNSNTARQDILDYFTLEKKADGTKRPKRIAMREPVFSFYAKRAPYSAEIFTRECDELREFYRTIARAGLNVTGLTGREKAMKAARKDLFSAQLRMLNEQMQVISEKLSALNQGSAAGRVQLAHHVAVDMYDAIVDDEINLFKYEGHRLKQVKNISDTIYELVERRGTETSFDTLKDTMRKIDQAIEDSRSVKSKLQSMIRSHATEFKTWNEKQQKVSDYFEHAQRQPIEPEDYPLFNEKCIETIRQPDGLDKAGVEDYLLHLKEAQKQSRSSSWLSINASLSRDLVEAHIHKKLEENFSETNARNSVSALPVRTTIDTVEYPLLRGESSRNNVAVACYDMHRTLCMRYMNESVNAPNAAARWNDVQKVIEFGLSDAELEIYIAFCLRAGKILDVGQYLFYANKLKSDQLDQFISRKVIAQKVWELIAPAHQQDFGQFYNVFFYAQGESAAHAKEVIQLLTNYFLSQDSGYFDVVNNLNKVSIIFKWGSERQKQELNKHIILALKQADSQDTFDKIFLHYLSINSVEQLMDAFKQEENNLPIPEGQQAYWLNLCNLFLAEDYIFKTVEQANPALWSKLFTLSLFERGEFAKTVAETCLVAESDDCKDTLRRVKAIQDADRICRFYEGREADYPADVQFQPKDIRESDYNRLNAAYTRKKPSYITQNVREIFSQNRVDLLVGACQFESSEARKLFLSLQEKFDPDFGAELLNLLPEKTHIDLKHLNISSGMKDKPPFFYFTLASLIQVMYEEIEWLDEENKLREMISLKEFVHNLFHEKDIFTFMEMLTEEDVEKLNLLNQALLLKESADSLDMRHAIQRIHKYINGTAKEEEVRAALTSIPPEHAHAKAYLHHIYDSLLSNSQKAREKIQSLLPLDEDVVMKSLEGYVNTITQTSNQTNPAVVSSPSGDEVSLYHLSENYEQVLPEINIQTLTVNIVSLAMEYCESYLKKDSYLILGSTEKNNPNNLSSEEDRERPNPHRLRLANRLITCYNIVRLKGSEQQRDELMRQMLELEDFYLEHGILHDEKDPPVRLNLCEKLFESAKLGSAGAATVRSARRGDSEKLHMSYEAYCARRYVILHDLSEEKLQTAIFEMMKNNQFMEAARLMKAWFLAKDYFEWPEPSSQIMSIVKKCIPFNNDEDMQAFLNSKIFEVLKLSSDILFRDELDDVKIGCQASLDFSKMINARLEMLRSIYELGGHITEKQKALLLNKLAASSLASEVYFSDKTKSEWSQVKISAIRNALISICEGDFVQGVNILNWESQEEIIRERIKFNTVEDSYLDNLKNGYSIYLTHNTESQPHLLFGQGVKFADELNKKIILPEELTQKAFKEGLKLLWDNFKLFKSGDNTHLRAFYDVLGLCATWEGFVPDSTIRDLFDLLQSSKSNNEERANAIQFARNNVSILAASNKPNAVILSALWDLKELNDKSEKLMLEANRNLSPVDFSKFITALNSFRELDVTQYFEVELNKFIDEILKGFRHTRFIREIFNRIETFDKAVQKIIYTSLCDEGIQAIRNDQLSSLSRLRLSVLFKAEPSDFLNACIELKNIAEIFPVIKRNMDTVATLPWGEKEKQAVQMILNDEQNKIREQLIVEALKSQENKTFAIEQLLTMANVGPQKEWAVLQLLNPERDFKIEFEDEKEKEAFFEKYNPASKREDVLLQLIYCQLWLQNNKLEQVMSCLEALLGGKLQDLKIEQDRFEQTPGVVRADKKEISPIQQRIQDKTVLENLKQNYVKLPEWRILINNKLTKLADLLREHEQGDMFIADVLYEMSGVLVKLAAKAKPQEQQQGQSSQSLLPAMRTGNLNRVMGGKQPNEPPPIDTGPSRPRT